MNTDSKKVVYVVGHKNPDTDSICSAIGYAHFKNATDKRFHFIPTRAGKMNEESTFILNRFGIPIPDEIESLSATVSDLTLKKPIFVRTTDSIQTLAQLMKETGVRSVPVVDTHNKVCGIVGLRDIAQHYMDSVNFFDLSKSPIELDLLVKTLDCRVVSNTSGIERLSGRVFITTMQKGTILNRIEKGDIVITGDQYDIQMEVIHAGCSAIITTNLMEPTSDVIKLAKEYGTLILVSPYNTFATVHLMTMSVPVESIMCRKIPTVGLYTPISVVLKNILESDYRSEIVVDSDNNLIGFITRTDLLVPVKKKVILVDHNEVSQAVDGIEEAEILEIIDHHRVGDISTVAPIYVYNDPVGSTCTVVANIMFLHQIRIPKEIAGVLLSGILSDTLILTLSTTTSKDVYAAEQLAELAGISIKEYGKELLSESINTKGKTSAELISADFKEFNIGGKKLGISQMMVLDCEEVNLREAELLEELERIKEIGNYDLTALLITNPISSRQERILLKGETWIVEKAFNVKVENNTCTLPHIMSRKRDFIPAIGQVLTMVR
ncbi:MAG: putative manganese-dependent inorganic diphosphatase [Thermodesulfovibrionales bacterium]|nr:putative manganese-dependent inorganic diphosphatase [Thermodesulfovibrionales bacterium]